MSKHRLLGQGATTNEVVKRLGKAGWNVVFKCVPNTPHFGVIPIPTSHGAGAQRYPDIFSAKRRALLFTEVEMTLSEAVARDIILRFGEMMTSLKDRETWDAWRGHIERTHKLILPATPDFLCELVVCKGLNAKAAPLVVMLKAQGISVSSAETYLQ